MFSNVSYYSIKLTLKRPTRSLRSPVFLMFSMVLLIIFAPTSSINATQKGSSIMLQAFNESYYPKLRATYKEKPRSFWGDRIYFHSEYDENLKDRIRFAKLSNASDQLLSVLMIGVSGITDPVSLIDALSQAETILGDLGIINRSSSKWKRWFYRANGWLAFTNNVANNVKAVKQIKMIQELDNLGSFVQAAKVDDAAESLKNLQLFGLGMVDMALDKTLLSQVKQRKQQDHLRYLINANQHGIAKQLRQLHKKAERDQLTSLEASALVALETQYFSLLRDMSSIDAAYWQEELKPTTGTIPYTSLTLMDLFPGYNNPESEKQMLDNARKLKKWAEMRIKERHNFAKQYYTHKIKQLLTTQQEKIKSPQPYSVPVSYGKYAWSKAKKINFSGQKSIVFEAKAKNDIHIALARSRRDNSPLYEIVIGGWNNTKSVIRKGRQTPPNGHATVNRGIRKRNKWQSYWVKEYKGKIEVGYGKRVGNNRFLIWKDPNPLRQLNWVAFSSWDSTVSVRAVQVKTQSKRKPMPTPLPVPGPAPEPPRQISKINNLGNVTHSQSPKTWTITVPKNYTKVELAIFAKGRNETNSYGGWKASMKVNGKKIWKFMRYDSKKGARIKDYITGREHWEKRGKGKWFNITSRVRPGRNKITYAHNTSGSGIGVKVQITSSIGGLISQQPGDRNSCGPGVPAWSPYSSFEKKIGGSIWISENSGGYVILCKNGQRLSVKKNKLSGASCRNTGSRYPWSSSTWKTLTSYGGLINTASVRKQDGGCTIKIHWDSGSPSIFRRNPNPR